MINQPWGSDGYSPLDFTLLDHHYGTISQWQAAITEIHNRGMYVIMDNTISTMGDLIGFNGFLNTTTPFWETEHTVSWKSDRQYPDFSFNNVYNETCQYPRFYGDNGEIVAVDQTSGFVGCFDSEFDQYGDTEAFGVFPDYQRQLSKFASVQDRLREWYPPVMEKIQAMTCLSIAMLDIDGFRLDKATQATPDALGNWSTSVRACAKRYGKENFFIPGEITGGDVFGSVYLGRGREPTMMPVSPIQALQLTNTSSNQYFIRDIGENALDAAAFHYSIYRYLTRFLGMDGNLTAAYDTPSNWVGMWNQMILTNDLVNANTGKWDVRHLYGTSNQDVFRWPAITNGVERNLLALFITTIHMPGSPLIFWGEEQAFYTLDSTAANYVFGRQSMHSALAWQLHGCYKLGASEFFDFPIGAGATACEDDSVNLDHRDPSAPMRNIIKAMFQMRTNYPVLNDGVFLQQLSNQTSFPVLPGSNSTPTETGIWSVLRAPYPDVQVLDGDNANQTVWLLYSNANTSQTYTFDCQNTGGALVAPYTPGTNVTNLFAPYETITLGASAVHTDIAGTKINAGCLSSIQMDPYGFKAYVPSAAWIGPSTMVTRFWPGHDARINSTVGPGEVQTLDFSISFSNTLTCDDIVKAINVTSRTETNTQATLGTTNCGASNDPIIPYVGAIQSSFTFNGTLENVAHGVHEITLTGITNSTDHFFLRVGQVNNPIVFPSLGNYTTGLLNQNADGSLYISHNAAGADQFRYSINWGSTWSDWIAYTGQNYSVGALNWTGTTAQEWTGHHVKVQYWSQIAGSSNHIQEGDVGLPANAPPRRLPHMWAMGPFNQYGYDAGLPSEVVQSSTDGLWRFHYMTEWPAVLQLNLWGMNPDGQPDQTFIYGDMDNDFVLDRLPPSTLTATVINITGGPPAPYLSYTFTLNDGTLRYELVPVGNRTQQMILFILLFTIPVLTGALAVYIFMKSFYQIKFNQVGVSEKTSYLPLPLKNLFKRRHSYEDDEEPGLGLMKQQNRSVSRLPGDGMLAAAAGSGEGTRRMVLIATMEYDIEDWKIKIKIGGLGVMAQLMGKNLGHQDLIWVVPCVGGVEYPIDEPAEPMAVIILGKEYIVDVQYHRLRNITYVLLDAPVFRQQTKSEPYPPRMDDLDSAIYYSAWNQCIALTIKRFNVDLYHINDYHGALAPVHLLPETIPCCLSLHNAEFQGLWPMRTEKERQEVCHVYNLEVDVALKYVQFGDVFNLLHAGSSYLRLHQKGFGAVGVSKKYGKRSWARYPIFWGLSKIGKLPNPDPTDTGEWSGEQTKETITVDPNFEAGRAEHKRKAQEWAGLIQNPKAELLVFVGRWSMQKGVDLIADVMPAILEDNKNVQLICVGPVIDLYGKFAALKLEVMMKKYPGRVYSKPEFTALEPFIFSGAEFALIPSRDEPFGLVAVEFGRKGALGIGARVGGLGQMPGWWYTVESTTTSHLLHQFRGALKEALASKREVRAMMRARSAKQRFPVAQWVEDLEKLQSTAIRIHYKEAAKGLNHPATPSGTRPGTPRSRQVSGIWANRDASDSASILDPPPGLAGTQGRGSFYRSPEATAVVEPPSSGGGLSRTLSLGTRSGPGHIARQDRMNQSSNQLTGLGTGVAIGDIEEDDEEDGSNGYVDEYTVTSDQVNRGRFLDRPLSTASGFASPRARSPYWGQNGASTPRLPYYDSDHDSTPGTPGPGMGFEGLAPPSAPFLQKHEKRLSNSSVLSLGSVTEGRKDFNLQKVDPNFTDADGTFYRAFETSLGKLDGKTSEDMLCIEDYIMKSEKKWVNEFRAAKLGKHQHAHSPAPSEFNKRLSRSPPASIFGDAVGDRMHKNDSLSEPDQFLLGPDYRPPTGIKKFLLRRVGDWPIYSFLLAFGQIIAANSYQITLLTGQIGETSTKLYIIATIYLITSVLWWVCFRRFKSLYALSMPFVFYGLAFIFLAFSPWLPSGGTGRVWILNLATAWYAIASSSGSIFFALNFGDEGGAPVKTWVYRACVIQGTQQAYICGLWYWGSKLTALSAAGQANVTTNVSDSWVMTAAAVPIALMLWAMGFLLHRGLPDYYRQAPGKVPSFYTSLFRRKIVTWFFVTVLIQNYWLSAPYGRNWTFLWSSGNAPQWVIFLLVVFFFGFVWAGMLFIFNRLSKSHSWILPVFAIGLGAPRWCQMLWGTSNIGQSVPWAGGLVSSAIVSRALWLWLGVLDALQGVGFGMILLQTLTRMHITFTLLAAQVLGSIATILARATAPNKIGPGDVFPDFSAGVSEPLSKAWFWVALFFQLFICIGFFTFFRKEQLSKP
jgi:alpha-1,3-glucan synthase